MSCHIIGEYVQVYIKGGPWGAPDPPPCKPFLSHRVKHDMEVDMTI